MAGDTQTLCVGECCAAEGAPRVAEKRDLCNRCYLRWWKATPPEARPVLPSQLPLAERIQANTNIGGPDECWEWTAGTDEHGYGIIWVDGRMRRAHRMALICAIGRDEPGTDACHSCDNPPCCNPNHLRFDTRKGNMQDAIDRGRKPVGSQCKQAILTEADVLAIRIRFAADEETVALAKEYKVKPTTITGIVRGRKWRHVGGPIVPPGTPQRRHKSTKHNPERKAA